MTMTMMMMMMMMMMMTMGSGGWHACAPPHSYPLLPWHQQWRVACVTHIPPHSHLFTPPVDGGDPFKNDGAAYNPHTIPSFNFVYSPLLGGFFSTVINDNGMVCIPHAAPFCLFYPSNVFNLI